jgi:hypothetical protein
MEATHNEASHTEANTSGEHGAKHAVNAEEHSTKGEKAHHEEAPKHYSGLGLPELFIFLGFVGMFLLTVFTTLSKYSLIPKNDAYLKESMNHHI